MNALVRWDPFKDGVLKVHLPKTEKAKLKAVEVKISWLSLRNRSQEPIVMPTPKIKASHKLGANRKELARKPRQRDQNFKQSRDIREDRGERQVKTVRATQTLARPVRGR